MNAIIEEIAARFDRAGCTAAWQVVDLSSGANLGVDAEAPVVMASVFKVLIALEFYAQADARLLDPAQMATLDLDAHTARPTGISRFEDPVRISLRDLCRMMMSVSDNTAADALLEVVGLDRVNARAHACGCSSTVIVSNLRNLWDEIGVDLGFSNHAELLRARAGALGPEAKRQSWNAPRMAACSAVDPMRTNRTTPRDMTSLLCSIWKNEAASPASCANLRAVMAQQVYQRLGRAIPSGGNFAGKTGTLTGWIRNEIGVVTHEDGSAYAAAFFTRAHKFLEGGAAIEAEMARAAASAIAALCPGR